MEYRKRAVRTVADPLESSLPSVNTSNNGVDDKFHRKHTKRWTGGARNLRQQMRNLSSLPLTMFILTVLFATYSFVTHFYFLSVSFPDVAPTSSSFVLHQKIIPGKVTLGKGSVPSHFLPQRPRTMGYYFENVKSDSFVGSEQMDPNIHRVSKSRPDLDVTEVQLDAREALLDSKEYDHHLADPFETGDCIAQYEWQKHSFPTCNHLMEQDMTNLRLNAEGKDEVRLIANGYWRDVWRSRNHLDRTVLKTIRYEHDYTPRNYDRHRRDAVAMERLTASNYVMNIYGFCGNSGVFEFADGGAIDDSIFSSKHQDDWNPKERLIVAYQVARGLADTHNFAKEGVAAIAHTDITPGQYVYVSDVGLYKLNDYNRCRFLRWDTKNNNTCTYHVGSNPGTFRSPEEYNYDPQTEKVDIYSMGNIFYTILVKLWPFEDTKTKKARKMVKAGERPPIPTDILNTTDPYDQSLLKAMEMCWIQDPEKRATARQVERFIDEELSRHGVTKE